MYPPLPLNPPIAVLRPDFCEELGVLDLIQRTLRASTTSPIPKTLAPLFPPDAKPEELANLADWVRLPDQVVYYERVLPDGKTTVPVVHITRGVRWDLKYSPLWNELVETVRTAWEDMPGRLLFQAKAEEGKAPLPSHVLIHDRRTGNIHAAEFKYHARALSYSLKWQNPTR